MRKFYKNTDTPPAIEFENSPSTGFTAVPPGDFLNVLWIAKYEQRKYDGEKYYLDIQIDLYQKILDATHTETEVNDFRNHTKDLADLIKEGNWILAQRACAALTTSGIFDTTKKAQIQADIDTYILNNY